MNKTDIIKQLTEASGLLIQAICDRQASYEVYRSIVVPNVRQWLKGEQIISVSSQDGVDYQTYTNGKKLMIYKGDNGSRVTIPMVKSSENREEYMEGSMDLVVQIIDGLIEELEDGGEEG